MVYNIFDYTFMVNQKKKKGMKNVNKYFFDDFPPEVSSVFPKRIKCVKLYTAKGKLIDTYSAPDDKNMSLTVYPTTETGYNNAGYVTYYEGYEDEAIVVFKPGEYFIVE